MNDIVIEQEEWSYDAGGNLIQSVLKQRFHDAGPYAGLLGDVNTNPKARVTYQAMWPDAIGRVRVNADYGTNGAAAFERPAVAPQPSDTVLVSFTRYGGDGQAAAQIDPAGVETRWVNDAAGRRIKLIENFKECACPGDTGANRITEYGYTPDGQLARLILRNDVTGNQVTRWVYSTTLDNSEVARNDLLRAKIYPESDDGDLPLDDGIDGVFERIEYSYNAQGQVISMKDPNGTVHEYDYDELGRLLHDRVTVLAEGIDGAVRRISREYEARGMLSKITSYNDPTVGSGTVVNQVENVYDAAGNLAEDRQSANGSVNSGTPAVRYEYATVQNLTTRLLSTTVLNLPFEKELNYSYDSTETDEWLSRVSDIGIEGEGTRVAYAYVGEARIVEIGYPEPDLTLSYIKGVLEPVGDAGDKYTGYDRFGRTVDMPWRQGEAGTVVDHFQYGFNRASNRLWKRQLAAPGGGQDEYYGYDGLSQVTSLQRGNLNINRTTIGGVPFQGESIDYDATGNWQRYQQTINGTVVLNQVRMHNQDNQTVQIDASSNGIGYDLAGNATLMPPTFGTWWNESNSMVWDAWNRLAVVTRFEESDAYRYDGLNRRLLRVGMTQTLYSKAWKPVAEFPPDLAGGGRFYLWGDLHRDELVLRDSHIDVHERKYVTHDYFNPTAIIDIEGAVLERYAYSAFGVRRVMEPSFVTIGFTNYDWKIGFQGQFLDFMTGFYNYGYRYYSPGLGRWLNRDPIGEVGGRNVYCMEENNAINRLDHLGLFVLAYEGEPSNVDLCGAHDWMIRFKLTPTPEYGGLVIQKITYDRFKVNDCEGHDKTPELPARKFFEVFGVLPGSSLSQEDSWGLGAQNCTSGELRIEGEAFFYNSWAYSDLPSDFAIDPSFPMNPVGYVSRNRIFFPRGSSSNRLVRRLKVTWDCCSDDKYTTISIL